MEMLHLRWSPSTEMRQDIGHEEKKARQGCCCAKAPYRDDCGPGQCSWHHALLLVLLFVNCLPHVQNAFFHVSPSKTHMYIVLFLFSCILFFHVFIAGFA